MPTLKLFSLVILTYYFWGCKTPKSSIDISKPLNQPINTVSNDSLMPEKTDGVTIIKCGGAYTEMAEYLGGDSALLQYLKENLRYPNLEKDNGIQGKVIVGITIYEDGSVNDVYIAKGLTDNFNNEAIRLVRSMPKWKPAQENGRTVRVNYKIPVIFKLP